MSRLAEGEAVITTWAFLAGFLFLQADGTERFIGSQWFGPFDDETTCEEVRITRTLLDVEEPKAYPIGVKNAVNIMQPCEKVHWVSPRDRKWYYLKKGDTKLRWSKPFGDLAHCVDWKRQEGVPTSRCFDMPKEWKP